MHVLRRLFALLIGLVGLAVLGLCVAGIVGTWMVKKPLSERTTRLLSDADRALTTAVDGVDVIQESLNKARNDLERFNAEAGKPPKERTKPGLVEQVVARNLESNFQNVGATVNVVTDASVVLNSILGSLSELPETSMTTFDTDRLKDIQGSLTDLTGKSRRLGGLLGNGGGAGSHEQAAQMKEVLDQVILWVTEVQGKVGAIKSDVDKLKARTPRWIHLGSVVITAVLGWIALSQLFVLGYAVYWFRGRHS
jgi:hypothetical protein